MLPRGIWCGCLTEEDSQTHGQCLLSSGLGGLKPPKPGETRTPPLPLGFPQETLIEQTSRGRPRAGDRPSQSRGHLGRRRPTGEECECNSGATMPTRGHGPLINEGQGGCRHGERLGGHGAGAMLMAPGWGGGSLTFTLLAGRHGCWR